MNEEILLKKSTLKTIDDNSISAKPSYNMESEIISKFIIEKLISLVLSELFTKKVETKIADYCFNDLVDILNDIKDLEFIKHDKDDLKKKHTVLTHISKTPKNKNHKYKNIMLLNKNEKKYLNKSQIIKGYKLIRKFDPNSSNCSINIKPLLPIEQQCFYDLEEHKVMKILKRKYFNDVNGEKEKEREEPSIKNKNEKIKNKNSEDLFKINNKQIERIEKIETIKLDNLPISNKNSENSDIIITSEIECHNSWETIPQPEHVIIDRYASTKLKIDNNFFKNYILDNNKDNNNNLENNEILNIKRDNITRNTKISKTKLEKRKLLLKYMNIDNIRNNDTPKKTRIIPIDFPSYDLDLEQEKTNGKEEPEEIKEMRITVEKEINKRKQEILEEQKEKEREKQKKGKITFKNKNGYVPGNITVDIKGNIVYINPIKIESLKKEFKNMGSQSKDIGRIKDETYVKKSFKNVKVEINQELDVFEQIEKSLKKANNSTKNNNSKIDTNSLRNKDKDKPLIIERNKNEDGKGMKFASGSNFDIINLECGVNLIENQKKKTGGKDYFQKYGRCSFEIFQEKLNKTSTNFFGLNNNDIINVNINDEDKSVKTNIDLPPLNIKKLKREKTEYEMKRTGPNSTNNIINLKTKNLKLALNNLDLINENKIKKLNENNIENKINFLKNSGTKEKDINIKKDLGAINIFNKTLMNNKLWGDPTESFQNQYITRKFPIKPEKKYLIKEKSQNELNHSPRTRLPPILTAMNEQDNKIENSKFSFNKKVKKKLKDLKKQNLSKDSLYENKSKKFLSGFYNNTE